MSGPLQLYDIVSYDDGSDQLGVVVQVHPEHYKDCPHVVARHRSVSIAMLDKFQTESIIPVGLVVVINTLLHAMRPVLVSEDCLILRQRDYQLGAIVQRSGHAKHGLVISTKTSVNLQPLCEPIQLNANSSQTAGFAALTECDDLCYKRRLKPPGSLKDIPLSELKWHGTQLLHGVGVVYKDRLGIVDKVSRMVQLKSEDNKITSAWADELDKGSRNVWVGDKLAVKPSEEAIGGIVAASCVIKPTCEVVDSADSWMAVRWEYKRVGSQSPMPAQILTSDVFHLPEFYVLSHVSKEVEGQGPLPMLTLKSEPELSINHRVRFIDLDAACDKYNGSNRHGKVTSVPAKHTLGYDMNLFDIVQSYQRLTVLWQDGSISESDAETLSNTKVERASTLWPGDLVHTHTIVSHPTKRGILVFPRIGIIQKAMAAQNIAQVRWCLNGAIEAVALAPGAHGGEGPLDLRLISVRTGEKLSDVETVSTYDIGGPGECTIRCRELVLLTQKRQAQFQHIGGPAWVGYVVQTHLDGSYRVRLYGGDGFQDITLRIDEIMETRVSPPETNTIINSLSASQVHEVESTMQNTVLDGSSQHSEQPEAAAEQDDHDVGQKADSAANQSDGEIGDISLLAELPDGYQALSYAMHAGHLPSDYLIQPDNNRAQNSTPSLAHMKRLQKEHSILQEDNALPPGVYVHAWENRLDALRVLFIGSEGTPYANAPFVIDLLMPQSYPNQPPEAILHYWNVAMQLGGSRELNPNFDREGQLCLSILGTWANETNERWSDKSTILQILVSIHGLVLNAEPYFNDPTIPEVKTDLAKQQSIAYNEGALLRSSGLIMAGVSAVQANNALSGLTVIKDDLRYLYISPNGPKLLAKALQRLSVLKAHSETGKHEPNGSTILSRGACIPLGTLVACLQNLQQSLENASTAS